MMIKIDSDSKTAHFLFVVVQDHELTFDTIIFSNQLK